MSNNEKPICRDCEKPIERGPYRNPLWVKLWCMEKQNPIYYHISCWNKRLAAELRREDEAIRKSLPPMPSRCANAGGD